MYTYATQIIIYVLCGGPSKNIRHLYLYGSVTRIYNKSSLIKK